MSSIASKVFEHIIIIRLEEYLWTSDNIFVRQGSVLSPILFNVYIDGLSNILNNCTTVGFLDGKRINHMLYANDLCMVSSSSAGLQNLLLICDKYCASHSITFNVKKSVCMFFKSSVNKHCDYANVYNEYWLCARNELFRRFVKLINENIY